MLSKSRIAVIPLGLAAMYMAACATTPVQTEPGLEEAATQHALSDDLIAAGIEAELEPAKRKEHLRLLGLSCDQEQLEACASLIALMPPGIARANRHKALLQQRQKSGFFVWSTLVYTASKTEREKLIHEASERFPNNDAFISMSDSVPERREALHAFVSNPTFMTLMQLSLRLAQNDEWTLLSEAMTLALQADVVDASNTAEFWILRSRIANRLKRLDLVWAYNSMAAMVRQRGKNNTSFLQVVSQQAARHVDTLDLLPTLLSFPAARGLKMDDSVLDGLRAHRIRVQIRGRELLAPNASKELVFGKGLIAALVGTRFEADLRRRRRLLAEAALQAPDNLQAWVRLAAVEDELKNVPEAIGALRNALRVDNDNPESLNNLAYMLALHRPQDLAEADALARRSLVMRPSSKTLDTLAEICFRLQRQAAALRFIRLAQKLEPDDKFYVLQEARIRAGDPSSPIPSEEE